MNSRVHHCWHESLGNAASYGLTCYRPVQTKYVVVASCTSSSTARTGAACRVVRARNRTVFCYRCEHRKQAAGFTLMEVLGALVLLTVLLVGVYGGVRSAIHGVRSGSAAIARVDQISSAQRFLRRELTQAMAQPMARDDQGAPIYFAGNTHEMRYVAPLPGYLGKLGPQLQVLRLASDGKGGLRLQLQLALLPPDGQPPKPLGEPQVLVDHIKAGAFSYRGRNGQGKELPWADTWQGSRLMPQLVRVQLRPQGQYDWPELDVPLRIDARAAVGHVGLLPGSVIRRQGVR